MLLVIRRWLILIVGGKGRSLRLQGLLIVVGGLSLDCLDHIFPFVILLFSLLILG